MKTIIVEDLVVHQNTLKHLLGEHFPDVQIVDTCASVDRAFASINKNNPDLVFLDIHLGNQSGFDLLEMFLQRNFRVIFTTVHDQYAIQAFKISDVDDYLLKPIELPDLEIALKESEKQLEINNLLVNRRLPLHEQKMSVKEKNLKQFIIIQNIIQIVADGQYSMIYYYDYDKSFIQKQVKNQDYVTFLQSQNLKHFQDILTAHPFFRIHNSFLINIKFLTGINSDENMITMRHIDEPTILARSQKVALNDFMRAKGFTI